MSIEKICRPAARVHHGAVTFVQLGASLMLLALFSCANDVSLDDPEVRNTDESRETELDAELVDAEPDTDSTPDQLSDSDDPTGEITDLPPETGDSTIDVTDVRDEVTPPDEREISTDGIETAADSHETEEADPETDTGSPQPDPVVYRAHDEADVCSSNPPADCTLSDMAWVASEYGFTVDRAPDGWTGSAPYVYRLVGLVERVGPSNIDVYVIDEAGSPIVGVRVAWWWPDVGSASGAVATSTDEWYASMLPGTTEASGRVGFMLAGSAYLPCCGCGGPHAVWISEPSASGAVPSDRAGALGMLGGTNHRHMDLVFQRWPLVGEPTGTARCPPWQ